mmetsp:Transcript_22266/g.63890  ORF Transcript_22266/g.63890 Transcript_22266/m.63890 type:complete len:387 (-) Transcript_22266:7-1167(-)
MSVLDTISASDVAAFRDRLIANGSLQPYRALDGSETPWQDSPAASDSSLRRFIYARKGDLAKAEAQFAAHLVWRRHVFPIDEDGIVGELLSDGRRFLRLGMTGDGLPLIAIDFQWGYFLEGCTALDCLRASLVFIERCIEINEPQDLPQACIISYGGPPPIDYAGALAILLEANYPERLQRGVIYPVPAILGRLVRAFLWIFDKNTAAKISIQWNEADILRFLGLCRTDLPERMRDGLEGAERQFKPDSHARMNRLLYGGIYAGLKPSQRLVQQLLDPNKAKQVATPKPSRAGRGSGFWACCLSRGEEDEPRPSRSRDAKFGWTPDRDASYGDGVICQPTSKRDEGNAKRQTLGMATVVALIAMVVCLLKCDVAGVSLAALADTLR